jgi:hypothetical protein
LPITDPRVKVLAPCVFSPSKWVVRPLTVRELAGCCDVQDAVVKRLPDLPVTRVSLGDMPFAVNAPAKLLGNFVDSLSEYYPSCLLRKPITLQTGTLGDQPRVPAIRPGDANDVAPRPAEELGGHSLAYLDESPSRTPKLTCIMVTGDEGGSSARHETANQFADECDPAVLFGRNKAAKNDDAEINYDYWDLPLVSPWAENSEFRARLDLFKAKHGVLPMTFIRKLGLRVWKRNVWKSLRRFLRRSHSTDWPSRRDDFQDSDLEANLTAARDCIHRCMHLDWWEWSSGSRLLFWRWPHESLEWTRDGLPIHPSNHPSPT